MQDTESFEQIQILSNQTYQFWTSYKSLIPSNFSYSNNISSQEIQNRIEIIIFDFINQLNTTGSIHLSLLSNSKSANYDEFTNVNRATNIKTTSLSTQKEYRTIAHILKILEISYGLLGNNLKATKREVFYLAADLFREQKFSDKAVEYACGLLEIPRNRLNILAAGKGLVAGNIVFSENGGSTDVGNRIVKVPFDVECIAELRVQAEFVLVVEKDTVLNRLVQEGVFEVFNMVAVTGCGYPDLGTREFLRRIVNEYSWIPVFILTDFDPHGFKILCTYTFGSTAMCSECDSLALPFSHWLGVHSSEGFKALPLGSSDRKLLEKLLVLPQLNMPLDSYQNKRFRMWKMQLEEMKQTDCKYEIESIGSLKEYIINKLTQGCWI